MREEDGGCIEVVEREVAVGHGVEGVPQLPWRRW
jgi:hypothetical protein